MNILIIDNSIALTGAFKCALNEATLLSDHHSFIFVLPAQSTLINDLRAKGYKVYALPIKEISRSFKAIITYPFFLLKNLVELKKIISRENVDVVQVNDFYNLLGAALKITGYRGRILTYVRFLPSAMPSALRILWIFFAQKYSSKVIAVSDAVLHQLPSNQKVIRIYDPVNFTENRSAEKQTDEKINLLYLANFTRGKGQEHAIEAFFRAWQQNKNLSLKFVGGDMGLAKNMQFKNELIQRVQELNLSENIVFENFTDNIEQEIKKADIVLNFSEAESFSMTCLEAAYYGTALIATRCGGPEEIIKHRETGLLVPKKSIQEMSEAIMFLSNNPELRKEYVQAGKKYVTEKFDKEKFKSSFLKVLKKNAD